MDRLIALSIGTTPFAGPTQIPIGGLPKAYSIGSDLITLAYVIAIIVALGFLIWGGVKWITSEGDKTKVQAARNTLLYSVIGLIVIFLSFFIINIITSIFGVSSVSGDPSVSSSHEGQYGCFNNKVNVNLPPGCSEYSPNNDPKEPLGWYADQQSCAASCH